MSFANSFGGFCVIHAAFLHPERESACRKELARVGIRDVHFVYSKKVDASDPRVATFKSYSANAAQYLSLTDAWKAAIKFAQDNDLESVVVFEDDIVFRKNFAELWREVEPQVATLDWDILTLHRYPEHDLLVLESAKEPTQLVPITFNLLTHCVAIHSRAYTRTIDALDFILNSGLAIDFFYSHISRQLGCSVYTTNKNLTGQYSGYVSSIQNRALNIPSFYRTFRCCGSKLEYNAIRKIYGIYKKIRNN